MIRQITVIHLAATILLFAITRLFAIPVGDSFLSGLFQFFQATWNLLVLPIHALDQVTTANVFGLKRGVVVLLMLLNSLLWGVVLAFLINIIQSLFNR